MIIELTFTKALARTFPEINNLKIAYKEGEAIKYKKNEVPISFHHLLSCTSGNAYEHHDPLVSELVSKKEVAPMKNGDDAFLKAPLVFTPGSQWGYGISYGWLGKAIEAISGLTLDENLKKYLCNPLGLKQTSFDPEQSSKEILPQYILGIRRVLTQTLLPRLLWALTHSTMVVVELHLP